MRNRKIGVLISGRGSNLQAIIDAIAAGGLDAKIAVVVSNKPNAPGLERAKRAGIETLYINHEDYGSREQFESRGGRRAQETRRRARVPRWFHAAAERSVRQGVP